MKTKIACFYQNSNNLKYQVVTFNESTKLGSDTQGYSSFDVAFIFSITLPNSNI